MKSILSAGPWNASWMRGSATPGTRRIFARSRLAKARLALRSAPAIWTSSGAGEPKLRIWVTMSAGRIGERRARKRLRQLLAQGFHIDGGRNLPLAQTDENVGVEDADRSGVAVGDVDAADRQADVVDDAGEPVRRNDRADLLLDLIGEEGRFLDAGPGRGAHVDLDRRRIDQRKEILAKKRRKAKRQQRDADEPEGEREAAPQRQLQQAEIALPEPLEIGLESSLKAAERSPRRRLGRPCRAPRDCAGCGAGNAPSSARGCR